MTLLKHDHTNEILYAIGSGPQLAGGLPTNIAFCDYFHLRLLLNLMSGNELHHHSPNPNNFRIRNHTNSNHIPNVNERQVILY